MNRPASEFQTNSETTPTVLVVEDEPAIREVVADLLQDEGFAVRQASDGLESIDELEVAEVDLSGVRFLPKPFDRAGLLHVIGSTLGASR